MNAGGWPAKQFFRVHLLRNGVARRAETPITHPMYSLRAAAKPLAQGRRQIAQCFQVVTRRSSSVIIILMEMDEGVYLAGFK